MVFIAEKNRGKKNKWGGGEKNRLSDHKLNITNGFIDGFRHVNNFVCKNNTSSYFLVSFFSFILFSL